MTASPRSARVVALSLIVWFVLCVTAITAWGLTLAWGRSGWLFGIGVLLCGPLVLGLWGLVIGAWHYMKGPT